LEPKEFKNQKINDDGKHMCVLTRDGWIQCFWRPLDVVRVGVYDASLLSLVYAQRLRAYSIHDMYHIKWNIGFNTALYKKYWV